MLEFLAAVIVGCILADAVLRFFDGFRFRDLLPKVPPIGQWHEGDILAALGIVAALGIIAVAIAAN